MKVAIIFGSASDKEVMKKANDILKEFDIETESYVLSAHRVPETLKETIKDLEERDFEVIIAGAGLAAHLPGVIASLTVLPIIGVPIKGAVEGLDALFSIVQMPKQIPVATVGINNSFNAGMLAIEILGIKYKEIKEKLINYRENMREEFLKGGNGKIEF